MNSKYRHLLCDVQVPWPVGQCEPVSLDWCEDQCSAQGRTSELGSYHHKEGSQCYGSEKEETA